MGGRADHGDEGECVGIGEDLGPKALQDGVHQQAHAVLISVAAVDALHQAAVLDAHEQAATLAVEEGTHVAPHVVLEGQAQVLAASPLELHVTCLTAQEGALEEPLLALDLLVRDGAVRACATGPLLVAGLLWGPSRWCVGKSGQWEAAA